jgi:hypothetical protein
MAYSSILGADSAPSQPSGRSADLLGPSDRSDSGSDAMGTSESHEDSDATGTGERGAVAGLDAREGGDIMPDRIVNMADEEILDADLDSVDLTDLDGDAPDDEAGEAR